jgi:hypothetical protein
MPRSPCYPSFPQQHGPYLPLVTDTLIATIIAAAIGQHHNIFHVPRWPLDARTHTQRFPERSALAQRHSPRLYVISAHPLHNRVLARPAHPRLPRPPPRRGQNQKRDHALPRTLYRTRNLPRPPCNNHRTRCPSVKASGIKADRQGGGSGCSTVPVTITSCGRGRRPTVSFAFSHWR